MWFNTNYVRISPQPSLLIIKSSIHRISSRSCNSTARQHGKRRGAEKVAKPWRLQETKGIDLINLSCAQLTRAWVRIRGNRQKFCLVGKQRFMTFTGNCQYFMNRKTNKLECWTCNCHSIWGKKPSTWTRCGCQGRSGTPKNKKEYYDQPPPFAVFVPLYLRSKSRTLKFDPAQI